MIPEFKRSCSRRVNVMKRLLPIFLLFSLCLTTGTAALGAKKKGCSRYVSPAYQQMKRNWQKVPTIPEPKWRGGYRDITIYSVNLGERFRFFPLNSDGTPAAEALEELSKAMADKNNRHTHPVHPRLLKVLYRLAVHFKARQINIISGYREPAEAQDKESHHADGSAIDIMMPGVPLPALAKMARSLGHAGVGFYPTSGFVHVDVRKGASYFWVDPSGPGKPGCLRRINAAEGSKADARWKAETDEPVVQKTKGGNLLGSPEAEAEAEELRDKKAAAKAKKTSKSNSSAKKKKKTAPRPADTDTAPTDTATDATAAGNP